MKAKKIMVVSHTSSTHLSAQESLDMALTAAAFDQDVSLCFCDDGIYQLLTDQSLYQSLGMKELNNIFYALSDYGINKVYADQQSIAKRRLSTNDFSMDVHLLYLADWKKLYRTLDIILHF